MANRKTQDKGSCIWRHVTERPQMFSHRLFRQCSHVFLGVKGQLLYNTDSFCISKCLLCDQRDFLKGVVHPKLEFNLPDVISLPGPCSCSSHEYCNKGHNAYFPPKHCVNVAIFRQIGLPRLLFFCFVLFSKSLAIVGFQRVESFPSVKLKTTYVD